MKLLKKGGLATPEALAAATELLKTAPDTWVHDICAGQLITAEGNPVSEHYISGYVCHSWVSPYGDKAKKTVLIFSTMKSEYTERSDATKAFVKWAATQAPFSEYILNRNDLSSIHHGGIIVDGACGSDLGMFICKTFRLLSEETFRVDMWHEMVKLGVSPMMALLSCQCLDAAWGGQKMATHATSFNPPTKLENIAAVLTKKSFEPREKYDGTGEGRSIFYKTDYLNYYASARDKEKHKIQINPEVKEKKVPDGWGGYTVERGGTSPEDVVKMLIELEQKALKGNG